MTCTYANFKFPTYVCLQNEENGKTVPYFLSSQRYHSGVTEVFVRCTWNVIPPDILIGAWFLRFFYLFFHLHLENTVGMF